MAGRITSGPNVADVNDNFSASFVTATDGKPALAVVNTDGTTISGGGGGGGTQYAEGVTTSPATGTVALARYSTSAPTLTNGQLNAPQLDSSGNLKVNVAAGGTSGTQYVELATTLPATGTLALGRYQTSLPTLTNGQMNEPQLDSSSRLLVNIASSSVTNQSTNLTQVAGSAIALGQATASASLPVVISSDQNTVTAVGNVASGSSDSGNPVKVGGRYNSTPPTLTNGQRGDLQLDASGNLKVNAAAMSGTTDSVAINDGTNTANVKSIASGNNALVVGQGFMEQSSLTSGSLNADLIASVDVSNYSEIALQVAGTWSGTLTTQFSNDNTNFSSYSSTTGSGAGTGNTITANGMYRITPMGRYMRVRMTAYTSGTATGVAEFYTVSGKPTLSAQYSVSQVGTWNVGSSSATGSSAPANAFYLGVLNSSGNLNGLNSFQQSGDGSSATGSLAVGAYLFNGTNYDRSRSGGVTGMAGVSTQASPSGGYSYNHQSANGTTTIKSGAGTLHTVTVNNAGTTDTITLYDAITGSGAVIAVIGSSGEATLTYDLAFSTGLTAVIAGTTAPDVTFTYK